MFVVLFSLLIGAIVFSIVYKFLVFRPFIQLNLKLYKKYIESDFEKYRRFDFECKQCQMGIDGYSEKGLFSNDYKRWKILQQEFMGKISESEKASYEKILFARVSNNPNFLDYCSKSWFVHSHWDWPLHMWKIPKEHKEGIQFAIREGGKLRSQRALQSEESRNVKSIVTNYGWCPKCTKKISAIATKCPYCTADL